MEWRWKCKWKWIETESVGVVIKKKKKKRERERRERTMNVQISIQKYLPNAQILRFRICRTQWAKEIEYCHGYWDVDADPDDDDDDECKSSGVQLRKRLPKIRHKKPNWMTVRRIESKPLSSSKQATIETRWPVWSRPMFKQFPHKIDLVTPFLFANETRLFRNRSQGHRSTIEWIGWYRTEKRIGKSIKSIQSVKCQFGINVLLCTTRPWLVLIGSNSVARNTFRSI